MTTDHDAYFTNVDEDTIPNSAEAPLIQWVNGDPRGAPDTIGYTGGWFLSADQPANTPGGFTPYELRTSTGKAIEGTACRAITVAVIRSRSQWIVTGPQGNVMFPWTQYAQAKELGGQKTPRGHTHALVVLRGAEDEGIFCLTMKGMTAKALVGRSGIIEQAKKHLQAPAKQLGKASQGKQFVGLPLHAFWLMLGPDVQGVELGMPGLGEPLFTEVGSAGQTSRITLLACHSFPPEPIKTMEALLSHLVPVQTRLDNDMLWQESQGWAKVWDGTSQAEEEPANRESPTMYDDASHPVDWVAQNKAQTNGNKPVDLESLEAASRASQHIHPQNTDKESQRKRGLARMMALANEQGLSPKGFQVWCHVMSGRSRATWTLSDMDRYIKGSDGFTGKNETQLLGATRAKIFYLATIAKFTRKDLDDWCGEHGIIQADEAGWSILEQLAGWLRDEEAVEVMHNGGHPESNLWRSEEIPAEPAEITIIPVDVSEDLIEEQWVDPDTGEVIEKTQETAPTSYKVWHSELTAQAWEAKIDLGVYEGFVCDHYNVETLETLSEVQHAKVLEWLTINPAWVKQQVKAYCRQLAETKRPILGQT